MTWNAPFKDLLMVVICSVLFLSCQSTQIDTRYAGWENVTLFAEGFGPIEKDWSISKRVQAVQTAKIDAYAQLESKIMDLRTDSGMKVSELAGKDETLRKKIAAFVRGAKITQTENSEAGVKMSTELFLGANFKATIGLSQKRPKSPPGLQKEEDLSR